MAETDSSYTEARALAAELGGFRPGTPVFDPELSPGDRSLLTRGEQSEFIMTGRRVVLVRLAPAAGLLTGLSGVWWLGGVEQELSTSDLPYAASTVGWLSFALLLGWSLFTGYVAFSVSVVPKSPRKGRRVGALRDRYVRPTDLTEDALVLLTRTQRAVHTVLGSSAHRLDLIDRQRNLLVLPQQEWEIAKTLLEYSRLTAKARWAKGEERATAERTLKAVLDSAQRRIGALEAYAAQVTRDEERAAHLDLLAQTVRDDLAVAELDALTADAAAALAAAEEFTGSRASGESDETPRPQGSGSAARRCAAEEPPAP
ncbi:hypothetical protein ACRWOO_11490 [Streptomyces sp. NEAU-PBA10]|uniref:hypothetical protein n=1 Tax=unclassified Streptomyces TaxID=2593676 RepID=UPI001EE414AD|nr:hypothetical protein [Streptomyces sp. T7(2022)]MCG5121561.1 hypothetical protein [Streptomyces sp. T7(2022)]